MRKVNWNLERMLEGTTDGFGTPVSDGVVSYWRRDGAIFTGVWVGETI